MDGLSRCFYLTFTWTNSSIYSDIKAAYCNNTPIQKLQAILICLTYFMKRVLVGKKGAF